MAQFYNVNLKNITVLKTGQVNFEHGGELEKGKEKIKKTYRFSKPPGPIKIY
jgi:hypothetical protein